MSSTTLNLDLSNGLWVLLFVDNVDEYDGSWVLLFIKYISDKKDLTQKNDKKENQYIIDLMV